MSDVEWITGSPDPEDYQGELGSGSARVVNTRDVAGANGFYQCVTIPEADGTVAFDATVWSRLADGEFLEGYTVLGLWFFANDDCNFSDQLDSIVPGNGTEMWGEVGVRDFLYPATTRSVRFDLRIDKFIEGGSVAGLFDHAYLPEPSGAAMAALAGLALAVLRRSR